MSEQPEEYCVGDVRPPERPAVFMPLPSDGAVVVSPTGQRLVLVEEARYHELLALADEAIGLD